MPATSRLVRLSAAVMLTAGMSLLTGTGAAAADPFDDDDVVQVNEPSVPDDAGEPEPQEAPDPEPEPAVEEPAPDDEPASDGAPDLPPGETGSEEDQSPDDAPDIVDPDSANADAADVDAATADEPEFADATETSEATVEEMRTRIDSEFLSTTDARITQWNSEWVQYSQWYQPVLVNPYRTPLTIAYSYGGGYYVTAIAPLQRAILSVPQPGVYSFTAMVPDAAGRVTNVSVGSFSGGGYVPQPGQPPPVKPAAPTTYRNVLVSFELGDTTYAPVTVRKVVDLGEDPTVTLSGVSLSKVLLDEETPAWGVWGTTENGARSFTVSLTDRLPGLTTPSAEPPPGYTLQAVDKDAAPADNSRMSALPWIGAGLGGAAVIAVILVLILGRRRRSAPYVE